MPDIDKREAIERKISQVLLNEWDPLGVRAQPDHVDEYLRFAHDIYGLLARGGSDVQVGRHLHHLERDELHLPDTEARDLTVVLRSLRLLERTI